MINIKLSSSILTRFPCIIGASILNSHKEIKNLRVRLINERANRNMGIHIRCSSLNFKLWCKKRLISPSMDYPFVTPVTVMFRFIMKPGLRLFLTKKKNELQVYRYLSISSTVTVNFMPHNLKLACRVGKFYLTKKMTN